MKRFFALSLLLFVLALSTGAQNQYWNYRSLHIVPDPQSAVSIVYSVDTIFYFQTNDANISISVIDPQTMTLSGNDAYDMGCYFILKGGFRDFSGNCVVFGHDEALSLPSFAVYDPSIPSLKNTTVSSGHSILDGCAGYDINGNQIYMFVLDNGQILAVNNNFNIYSITTTSGEYYTDISWDASHQLFIATGPVSHVQSNPGSYPGFFVDLFKYDAVTPAVTHTLQYYLDNNETWNTGEIQSMHAKLHDDTLLVYRDLRASKQEIIWLTTISDYSNSSRAVDSSYFFLIPTHKMFALDMLYDPFHQRLNFLGEIVFCTLHNAQFLAQVDPYNFYAGMNAKQLDGSFAISSPCPSMFSPTIDIYGSYLNTTNLALDTFHECIPVLVAGADDYHGISTLTETYDISQSGCDLMLPVKWKPASPIIATYTLTTTLGHPSCSISNALPLYDIVRDSVLCYGPEACPSLVRDSLTKVMAITPESEPEIRLSESRQFYCLGFEGDIQYYIYDMSGRMVLMGKTYNGQYNPLLEKCGIYILRAVDSKGNLAVKKIISIP